MAPSAPLPIGGYDCEFVDSLPDSLTCPVCLLPFRDPHLLSCCGANICETCIGRVKAADRPCPLCKQPFVSLLDKGFRRKVLDLKVRCSRKKGGCKWEGELRHLENHEREGCGWAFFQCRYCGGRVLRRQLVVHEHEECPQRPMDVKLKIFVRKMEVELTSEKEHYKREISGVREEMEQQKKEYEAKMKQLEQSLQRKLRADTEQQLVKLRKEVEEEVIPQCTLMILNETRGEPHKCCSEMVDKNNK